MWLPALLLAACSDYGVEGLPPELTVSAESVSFEDVALSSEGEALVTLGNAGGGTLQLESFSTASPFSVEGAVQDLEPGASLGLTVRLYAFEAGTLVGALRIASNDPEHPTLDVPLSALVLAPSLRLEPERLVFVGDGSAQSQRVYISNEGEGPLLIDAASLSDDGGGAFNLELGWSDLRLEPQDIAQLDVGCAVSGMATGALLVRSNDPDAPAAEVWLGAEDPDNTHPAAPMVGITPAEPEEGDGLLCSILEPAADTEGDSIGYAFGWRQDGSAWTGATSSASYPGDSIDGAETQDLEVWTCTVTPSDPWGDGEQGQASVRIGCFYGAEELCPGLSCRDILEQGFSTGDGAYWIDPSSEGPYQVYCDMSLDGGGWTLTMVSSDDNQTTWTWDNRHYLDSDTTTFGSLDALDHDFKSAAHHEVVYEDLLFLHQPSGVWAAYAGVGDGGGTFAAAIEETGAPACYEHGQGYPLTGGTLALEGRLCSTELFLNAPDRDGGDCGYGNHNDTWGPAWSAENNDGCPFDDPTGSSMGPDSSNASAEIDASFVYSGSPGTIYGHGFGFALGANVGSPGAAENYLQVYVR